MNPDQAVHKAALLLDLKGDYAGAELVLRKALSANAEATAGRLTALVMLAELVHRRRPEEALPLAQAAASIILPEDAEAVAAADRTRARELVAALLASGSSSGDPR